MNSLSVAQATNHVHLVGTVSASPVERELPSGDVIVTFNIVLPRPVSKASKVRVDTIECAAWTARLRRRALRLEPGTIVEVQGHLRRRFTRAGNRPISFTSVEVVSLVRGVVPAAE